MGYLSLRRVNQDLRSERLFGAIHFVYFQINTQMFDCGAAELIRIVAIDSNCKRGGSRPAFSDVETNDRFCRLRHACSLTNNRRQRVTETTYRLEPEC